MNHILDLYSDYLLASFSQTSATGLSNLLNGEISHDQVTRFLWQNKQTSKDLWRRVKPFVKQMSSAKGVLILDDSIEEKPYTDENEIIAWHYDHSKARNVKGINFVSCLYQNSFENQSLALPIGFELVAKTEKYVDKETQKEKRRSPTTKNEMARTMIAQAVRNQVQFGYVLFDVWFSSAENIKFIKQDCQKEVICPLKANRRIALSWADKKQGRWKQVSTLDMKANTVLEIWLEGVEFPLLLSKQVFTNEDGSDGILYLVTSDTTLLADQITTIYQRRWSVEVYHKSLKQNVSLTKSPTQTQTTQTNHFFAALCGYIKLEMLKVQTKTNHFALKTKLYLNAIQAAFQTLRKMNTIHFNA
ncbi:MAG: transposase [Chitinophagales bacterium]|nr:transposase [Bacteroidota bacterium]MCB9042252.1 transposase [Chitinophagales bacterium]